PRAARRSARYSGAGRSRPGASGSSTLVVSMAISSLASRTTSSAALIVCCIAATLPGAHTPRIERRSQPGSRARPPPPVGSRVASVVQDVWEAGDSYEAYVGRWSRRVAEIFVPWVGAGPGTRWLDVGCGTGALTAAVLAG